MAMEVELQVDYAADTKYGFVMKDMAQNPLDLTGYTAQLKILRHRMSDVELDVLELGDGITAEAGKGILWVTFSEERTSGYQWVKGWYRFDITAPGGDVTRIAYGPIIIRR